MNATDLLGKGVYSVPEAARIIQTDTRSIRRWTEGYTTQKTKHFSPPILPTPILRIDDEEIVTFLQLIECMFISLFRKNQIKMAVIRSAAAYAARLFDTDHPFAVENFKTDGKSIFHVQHLSIDDKEGMSEAQILVNIQRSQFVFAEFVVPHFHKIDYERFEAARFWPLGKDKSVVIDPRRSFGQAIDVKTGVPTKALYGMYNSGDSVDAIGEWYNVQRQSVIDAIAFETSLLSKAA